MQQHEDMTAPTTAPPGPALCAHCNQPATHSYSWEWGENGVCCTAQQFLLNQSAGQLGRSIQFAQLVPSGPVAMTRDERTRLKGENYALLEEIEDLKTRGLDMYRENERISRQLQAVTVRSRETEARLKDAETLAVKLRSELEGRDAEHGTLVDEVERLRTLATFSEPRSTNG